MDAPKNAIEALRRLADWFDVVYKDAGSGNDEVQQDLRKWADELENQQQYILELEKKVKELEAEILASLAFDYTVDDSGCEREETESLSPDEEDD